MKISTKILEDKPGTYAKLPISQEEFEKSWDDVKVYFRNPEPPVKKKKTHTRTLWEDKSVEVAFPEADLRLVLIPIKESLPDTIRVILYQGDKIHTEHDENLYELLDSMDVDFWRNLGWTLSSRRKILFYFLDLANQREV